MRKPDLYDGMALLGLIFIGAGLAMWSIPLALVTIGSILLTAGVVGAVFKARGK